MTVLVFAELLAGSVWAGGLVAIAVAARSARAELGPAAQAAFFRTLGRGYLRVGGGALVVSLACGSALLARGSWGTGKTLATAGAAALVLVAAAAVLQARAVSRLSIESPDGRGSPPAAKSVRRAGLLRAAVGILTLAELALAAGLAT